MKDVFLTSTRKQFEYYKMLGDRSFAQLNDKDLFWQYNEESNSIAIIVKHMWGNMLSRWTAFLTSDGEKEWRQRETEFEADIKDVNELLENEKIDILPNPNNGNFQVNFKNVEIKDIVIYQLK